jgi:hypothetical protein
VRQGGYRDVDARATDVSISICIEDVWISLMVLHVEKGWVELRLPVRGMTCPLAMASSTSPLVNRPLRPAQHTTHRTG